MVLSLLFGIYFIFFTYHRYHSLRKHRSSRQATLNLLALSTMLEMNICMYVFTKFTTVFCYVWTNNALILLDFFLSHITNFLRAYKIISTKFMCANNDTFLSHANKTFLKWGNCLPINSVLIQFVKLWYSRHKTEIERTVFLFKHQSTLIKGINEKR